MTACCKAMTRKPPGLREMELLRHDKQCSPIIGEDMINKATVAQGPPESYASFVFDDSVAAARSPEDTARLRYPWKLSFVVVVEMLRPPRPPQVLSIVHPSTQLALSASRAESENATLSRKTMCGVAGTFRREACQFGETYDATRCIALRRVGSNEIGAPGGKKFPSLGCDSVSLGRGLGLWHMSVFMAAGPGDADMLRGHPHWLLSSRGNRRRNGPEGKPTVMLASWPSRHEREEKPPARRLDESVAVENRVSSHSRPTSTAMRCPPRAHRWLIKHVVALQMDAATLCALCRPVGAHPLICRYACKLSVLQAPSRLSDSFIHLLDQHTTVSSSGGGNSQSAELDRNPARPSIVPSQLFVLRPDALLCVISTRLDRYTEDLARGHVKESPAICPTSLPCAPWEDSSNRATLPTMLSVAIKVLHDDQRYSEVRSAKAAHEGLLTNSISGNHEPSRRTIDPTPAGSAFPAQIQ
ncbi:hypothetical protein FB567DRAFT_552791 [Paraphoma chrysanthemicola]|uniref:Uncharacterized protein n=1 Tax=Paraphoma chrysanthemicola TaxID=798071 RepID=A0A8K0VU44_9PLEO|nr:hypothetical protein FB567DRAFT_552791 [Paraphoma chrysanthemicola]